MTKLKTLILLGALAVGLMAAPVQAQTVLNTTTLSAAITPALTTFNVASTANIQAGYGLFVPITGEYMSVISVPVSGTVQVRRGVSPTRPYDAASSATVIIVPSVNALIDYDPGGACTRGSGIARFSPVINLANGNLAVCRSSTWNLTNLRPVTYNSLAPFTP